MRRFSDYHAGSENQTGVLVCGDFMTPHRSREHVKTTWKKDGKSHMMSPSGPPFVRCFDTQSSRTVMQNGQAKHLNRGLQPRPLLRGYSTRPWRVQLVELASRHSSNPKHHGSLRVHHASHTPALARHTVDTEKTLDSQNLKGVPERPGARASLFEVAQEQGTYRFIHSILGELYTVQ